MRNLWLITKREYIGRGLTSAYLITTAFMVLMLVFTTLAPVLFDSKENARPMTVVLLDRTGKVGGPLRQALQSMPTPAKGGGKITLEDSKEGEAALIERARKSSIAALIVDGTFPTAVKARFLSGSVGTMTASSLVIAPLESIVRSARLQALGLDPTIAGQILKPMEVEEGQLTAGSGQRDQKGFTASILTAISAVMMIYLVTLLNGTFVFQGVLEEKMSRVMEVMAAAVSPAELMAGKVLGLGALGLTQFAVFLAGWFGSNLWAQKVSSVAPQALPGKVLLLGLVFLVLGYILNSTLMAAAASTLSRMEDSQTMLMPITMLLVIPMLLISPVINEPNGTLAVVLSLVPFFAPTIMLLRVAVGDVPSWQIGLSVALMVVSTYYMVRAAAKVYRAALLSYGGRPSMKQLWLYLKTG